MKIRRGAGNLVATVLVAAFLLVPAAVVYARQPEESIACGFSSDGTAMALVLEAIRNSKESVLVAAYSFTSKPIAEELSKARRRGVSVLVVADSKANTGSYTAVTFLANQGVPVRLNDHYAIMHHKFMVVDGRHVQTGSFNYTNAAQKRNAENVILVYDNPELASRYVEEWNRLWAEGKEIPARY